EEGAKMLARMPKLKLQQELRKNYIKLVEGGLPAEQFLNLRKDTLAAMKLDREDAEAFTRKLMGAVAMVSDNYVKELNQGEMEAGAVKGLYRRLEEKLPADVKASLEKPKDLKRSQLIELLTDARTRLGKREDLAEGKDVEL